MIGKCHRIYIYLNMTNISGYKNPVPIENGEWWYMGYTITKQIHPLLKKYIVRSDKNWIVNPFNSFKECCNFCKLNAIFDPVYTPIDYLH